jgi:hypothetical protein
MTREKGWHHQTVSWLSKLVFAHSVIPSIDHRPLRAHHLAKLAMLPLLGSAALAAFRGQNVTVAGDRTVVRQSPTSALPLDKWALSIGLGRERSTDPIQPGDFWEFIPSYLCAGLDSIRCSALRCHSACSQLNIEQPTALSHIWRPVRAGARPRRRPSSPLRLRATIR